MTARAAWGQPSHAIPPFKAQAEHRSCKLLIPLGLVLKHTPRATPPPSLTRPPPPPPRPPLPPTCRLSPRPAALMDSRKMKMSESGRLKSRMASSRISSGVEPSMRLGGGGACGSEGVRECVCVWGGGRGLLLWNVGVGYVRRFRVACGTLEWMNGDGRVARGSIHLPLCLHSRFRWFWLVFTTPLSPFPPFTPLSPLSPSPPPPGT